VHLKPKENHLSDRNVVVMFEYVLLEKKEFCVETQCGSSAQEYNRSLELGAEPRPLDRVRYPAGADAAARNEHAAGSDCSLEPAAAAAVVAAGLAAEQVP